MKLMIILTFISFNIFADDAVLERPELYQEVLKRHVQQGHISKEDVEKQKFLYEKDKEWRSNHGKQLRGVASSLKVPRDIIELDNPAIEIPVN